MISKTQIILKIRERQAFLKDLLAKAGNSEVEGVLRIKKERGATRYYVRSSSKDTIGRYLTRDDEALIEKLCVKRYKSEVEKAALKELGQLERCLEILKEDGTSDAGKVYGNLPEAIRSHLKTDEICDDCAVAGFRARYKKVARLYISPEEALKTAGGERVRSKSEVIIADQLMMNGVPYAYECETMVNGLRRYPDFTVLNARTGKIYIWEHLGMMDNAEYCRKNQEKMEDYAEAGYFPGENMIVTFESNSAPVSTDYVRRIIRRYLK